MGIIAENLSKAFLGRPVLEDVSFEVKDGDFTAFLAPTGEGKTTLLRILAGVEMPDRGRVLYDGKDVTNLPLRKRNIAMVYQAFVNYPSMNVYENIASPLRASGKVKAEEVDRRVRDTAALLKIDGILDHLPSEISGGQQQRLAIARALVKNADYVFLDEPLTNLDYKLQEELRTELKELFSRRGHGAIVFATPQPVEALALSSHVGFLCRGRLMQYGPTRELYRNPQFRELGSYFSHPSMNIIPSSLVEEGGSLWLKATGQLKVNVDAWRSLLTGSEYLLGIRAHWLSMVRSTAGDIPVAARVELSEVVGSDTELHLKHESHSLVMLEQGLDKHSLGSEVHVFLNPERFFIFDAVTGRLVAKTHRD